MQQFIVTVVVLFAAAAVARRYAPAPWKAACNSLAVRFARLAGLNALAERLSSRPKAASGCASSCATCSGCDAVGKTPSGEFVVLIERIKRKE